MKKGITRLVATVLLAVSGPASAEVAIYNGFTLIDYYSWIYDLAANESKVARNRSKDTQIALLSSLGNLWYTLYYLDRQDKVAYKYEGTFLKGPMYFENIKLKGDKTRTIELWKTFNASWDEDLDEDTEADTFNFKSGQLSGTRSLVPLMDAGFPIELSRTLKGAHTHTRYSDLVAPMLADPSMIGSGRFFSRNNSKSTFRLQKSWTDAANVAGGELTHGIEVVENYLVEKGYSIQPMAGLNAEF